MPSPIWVLLFDHHGRQWLTIPCASALEADGVIYHNTYYGHRCLKISVKAWRL